MEDVCADDAVPTIRWQIIRLGEICYHRRPLVGLVDVENVDGVGAAVSGGVLVRFELEAVATDVHTVGAEIPLDEVAVSR